jgi:hypothetical protein
MEISTKENINDKTQQKWMNIWSSFKEQFSVLPSYAQDILFDDINTAVQNRLVVMQRTQKQS